MLSKGDDRTAAAVGRHGVPPDYNAHHNGPWHQICGKEYPKYETKSNFCPGRSRRNAWSPSSRSPQAAATITARMVEAIMRFPPPATAKVILLPPIAKAPPTKSAPMQPCTGIWARARTPCTSPPFIPTNPIPVLLLFLELHITS